MTEQELTQVNKALYNYAKILWIENKGYTSNLFEDMIQKGYTMRKSGAVSFMVDKEGKTIASGVGRIDFLQRLAEMMR